MIFPAIFSGDDSIPLALATTPNPVTPTTEANNFFNTDYSFYNKMDAKLFTISAGIHLENQSKK